MCTFWLDVLSNFLATAAGLILGVPAGLWLDRYIRNRNEVEKRVEAKKREHKILTILRKELADNIQMMSLLYRDFANGYYPVAFESWRAFSDGGELQWIDDPELLSKLSFAYARISQYSFLLEKCVEAVYFQGSIGNLNRKDDLFTLTVKKKDEFIKELNEVMEVLNAKLSSLASGLPKSNYSMAASQK